MLSLGLHHVIIEQKKTKKNYKIFFQLETFPKVAQKSEMSCLFIYSVSLVFTINECNSCVGSFLTHKQKSMHITFKSSLESGLVLVQCQCWRWFRFVKHFQQLMFSPV